MEEFLWLLAVGAIFLLLVGIWLGRQSKQNHIQNLEGTITRNKTQCIKVIEQHQAEIKKISSDKINLQTLLQKNKGKIDRLKNECADLKARDDEVMAENKGLHELYSSTLENLRNEGALLPSAVRWASKIRESLDLIGVHQLESPPHPAPSAANQVKMAKGQARQWQQEAELLRNQLDLYESQAPWLIEYAEYTVDEIIAGLREEQEIRRVSWSGEDPVRLFLSSTEWNQLSSTEKNQLALDRYWESSRKRSAWVAGIQYERYIGYLYEKDGFEVEYHGATQGKQDLGIDLICEKDGDMRVIQCKRLSPQKAIPVRENVVAQIYGAAMFYAMRSGIDMSMVKPVVTTTFELSDDARQFAEILGVTAQENVALEQYPCIKCNISGRTGERIYHLPFDQQYDSTKIGNVDGEFYAMTVVEAERSKFRRAFRWHGEAS